MKISELNSGQGNVEAEFVVKELEEPKTFNKFGRELRLRNAVVEDDSGTVKLTLWNDDVDKFAVGDKIKLTNGYVNEFQGEKQLTSGKFGKLEKAGEGDTEIKTDSTTTAEEPEEAAGMEEPVTEAVKEETEKEDIPEK